jgi:hypothetical protein
MSNPLVLYHGGGCFDGFGAAWVANKALPQPELVPMTYGTPTPKFDNLAERDVYMVDFSLPRGQMLELHATAKSLQVLDHHKSAQAACEGLEFCQFDMNRSGAGMAWDWWFPNLPRPALIDYVEDRDLWRFRLPKSREIHAFISSWPKELAVWDMLHDAVGYSYGECVQSGADILRYHTQKAKEIAEFETTQEIGGHMVPVVNAPYNFASDVVHLLCERHPEAPFAASYFFRADGTKQYSLRVHDTKDFDVSEVAKQYGGGGHMRASGYEVKPA